MEWAFVPESCIMTDGALHLMTRVLQGLRVNPERMARNLDALDGMMMSEAVMLVLALHVGRQTAHEIVYSCAMRAVEQDTPFRSLLAQHPVVARYISTQELEELLDPRRYTGLSEQFVDRVAGMPESNGQSRRGKG